MRDSDVREAVRRRLYKAHAGDAQTRIVEEMGIWASTVRIDMAVINGLFWGFEIKSDNDTLERLPGQAELYSKVFDRVTLIVGSKHLEGALGIVPEWWGCMSATMRRGQVVLRPKRPARRNPCLDLHITAQLLWKEEAVAVLERYGLADGWRSKRSSEILSRILSHLSPSQLRECVRDALRARERLGQLVAGEFNMPINAEAYPIGWASSRS